MKVTVFKEEQEVSFEPENYQDLIVLVCRLLPEKPIGVWNTEIWITKTLDTLVDFLREHSRCASAVADVVSAGWVTQDVELVKMTIELPQIGEVSKDQKW